MSPRVLALAYLPTTRDKGMRAAGGNFVSFLGIARVNELRARE